MDWKGSKQLAVLDGAAKKFRNSSSGMKIAAKRAQESSHSRTASLLIWDFSLDEFRQQRQRFLPATTKGFFDLSAGPKAQISHKVLVVMTKPLADIFCQPDGVAKQRCRRNA